MKLGAFVVTLLACCLWGPDLFADQGQTSTTPPRPSSAPKPPTDSQADQQQGRGTESAGQNQPFSIEDRFLTDNRADYKMVGKIGWSAGKLSMPEQTGLSRASLSGPRFLIELDIDPQLNGSGTSATRLNLPMTQGREAIVLIVRQKQGETYRSQLDVAFAYQSDSGERTVKRIARGPLTLSEGEPERWVLRFNYGVLQAHVNGKSLGSTFIESDGLWYAGAVVTCVSGNLDITRLKIAGKDPTLSAQQVAAYQRIREIDRQRNELSLDQFDPWMTLTQEQIDLMRHTFGADYYGTGFAYDLIASYQRRLEKYDDAIKSYVEANRIFSSSLGEAHPRATMSRILIGECFVKQGKLVRGTELILPNLVVLLKVAGPNGNPSRKASAIATNALIEYDRKMCDTGRYQEAYQAAKHVKSLLELQYGDDTNRYYWHEQRLRFVRQLASSNGIKQGTLATIDAKLRAVEGLKDAANEREALAQLLELRDLCVEHLGSLHPYTLRTQMQTNVSRTNLGDFGVAIRDVHDVVQKWESTVGNQHPIFAQAICDLASTYSMHQSYDKAAPLFDQAIEILSNSPGLWGHSRATALLERGRHYQRLGKIHLAERDLTEAYEYLVESGEETGSTAIVVLDRLIDIQRTRVNLPGAANLLKKQRDLVSNRFGEESGAYYRILFSEAIEADWQGDVQTATKKYTEARIRAREYFGPHSRAHKSVTESEIEFHLRNSNYDRAGQLLRDLVDFQRNRREMLFDVYSTSEQFDRSMLDQQLQNQVMLLASNGKLKPADAYQMVLSTKGSVAAYQRRQAFARRDPALKKDFERLQVVSSALSNLGSLPRVLRRESELRHSAERMEIKRRISDHNRKNSESWDQTTPSSICASLTPGSVIIDYVEFSAQKNSQIPIFAKSQRQLAAFVYSSDSEVRLINLGPSIEIEAALSGWFKAIGFEMRQPMTVAGDSPQQIVDKAGMKARKLILDPILAGRPPPQSLVISPAGCLTLCPFDAFPLRRDGTLLIEQLPVSYTLAAQLMADIGFRRKRSLVSSALIVGDIDYGHSARRGADPFLPLGNALQLSPIRSIFERNLGSGQVTQLLGEEATELAVTKQAPGKQHVLIDTHGFYTEARNLAGAVSPERPKMVAGVALAGANSTLLRTSALGGILFDSEIAAMDWTSAELVVLAACETAFGEFRPGEGMQGLHRALAVSGAASSISTLWVVHVNASIQLTTAFYEALLDEGLSKSEALRKAKIKMIRSQPSHAPNVRYPIYLWAPFVLYGDQ